MRHFPLVALLTCFGFLLACCGGGSQSVTEFTEGFNEGFDQSFKATYRENFVKSCVAEINNMPKPEALRMCSCTADRIIPPRSPAELTRLDSEPNSPASQKIFTDAVTACMPSP